MKLTIVMPCLNEAETLATCIGKAKAWAARSGVECEVLIADNGSTDGSQGIAEALGARVVPVAARGYGAALSQGCLAAQGEYIIMGDSDDSYDFSELDLFVQKLDEGYDLVMGNRFMGGIAPGAMPWKNRYFGNPFLTWVGRLLFSCPSNDFNCGLRGFTKAAFLRMDLRTPGMEFASEMVIRVSLLGLRIAEIPTTLSRDGRSRPPHMRPWRDGWRNLRFMLLYSPRHLLLIPGLCLLFASLAAYALLLVGPVPVGRVVFDVHTLFYAQAGIMLGALATAFSLIIKMIGVRLGLLREHPLLAKISAYPLLEVGGLVGIGMILSGLYWGACSLVSWSAAGFGPLAQGELLRTVSLSTTLIMLGGVTLMSSLIMGFLALPGRREP